MSRSRRYEKYNTSDDSNAKHLGPISFSARVRKEGSEQN
jgi:hypothetical protein